MRDLQFSDEHECTNIFTTVGNLDELVLRVTDVRLESVALSHFDGDEIMVILLCLSTGDVLGEKRLSISLNL